MNQEELDYAEGMPAAPDKPAPDPTPDPVRPDPILIVSWTAGVIAAVGVVLALDRAGVDDLGSGWALLAYGAAGYSVSIPIILLGRWLSRRVNWGHDNPNGCTTTVSTG